MTSQRDPPHVNPLPSHPTPPHVNSPLLPYVTRIQELEKFKFVLDFKIKELKAMIDPRENEIADMRTQVRTSKKITSSGIFGFL